ncbi:triose-phosphate isomerase [Castellaniella sp. S9]|uniref:triose-phosphate isomerase n=1 Tax=Castellaniella sp. S9 TaxID=2993652 RepID=UPI0022B32986|nr:triose-phosphate isomerase [Castellaniella sp. S9]
MSHTRKRLVMGNWKMHGSFAANAALLDELVAEAPQAGDAEVAVCAPFPYLAQLQGTLAGSPISWGAQDVSIHTQGAYTGEVSAGMLADFGCTWVLCGHSERRALHGETSDQVAAKAATALAAGLTPVVCVGETLDDRDGDQVECVIGDQLEPVLALGTEALGRLVIAYEPVWAIGTGRTATPEQAQAVHAFIRQSLTQQGAGQVRILYGGSVKAGNAASLFAQPDIDGALVGGASLVAQEFLNIAAA